MNDRFDPRAYGEAFARAIGDEPLMPLGAGSSEPSQLETLESLSADAAGELIVTDQDALDCCLAGVWLLHGYLDRAHRLCQDVATPSGSYWHGVMHRREGDYGNAQYWFRQAGDHPAGAAIASTAAANPQTVELARGGRWEPVAFVDLVRSAIGRGDEVTEACVELQRAEWRALFDYCYRAATAPE